MKYIQQIFCAFIFLWCSFGLQAQNAPAGINYQAVLRDAQGQILADQSIKIRVSVLDPESRNTFFTETHQITTSNLGIFNLVIGGGKAEKGTFNGIPWSTANTWLEVAYDTDNNGIYDITGTTRMLSVPYAFYAEKAGSAVNSLGPVGTEGGGGDVGGDFAWMLKGNDNVDENVMWLGTRNRADLVIKTHDKERIRITKGNASDSHDALIDLQEDVLAEKSLTVGTTLQVGGQTLLQNELMVAGNVFFNSDMDLLGNAKIGKLLWVKGNLNTDGDVVFNQDLTVLDDASFWGDVKIDGNLNVHHSLFVDIDGDFGRNLHVGNDADIDHNLNVDNDGHFGRDLDVDRNANIDENLHVGNDADIDHNLNVDNDGHFGRDLDVDRNANVDENLHVGNDADIDHDLNVDHDLTVQNDAFIKGDLDVDGTGTFLDLVAERDLSVGRDADIGRNLNVDIDVHIGHDLDVDNYLNVDGSTNIDIDLNVENNVTIQNNLYVDNSVEINNNLYVDNSVEINVDLDVNHNVNIDNNLYVDNSTTINNDLTVNQDVYVGGTLQVANPITANCRLVVNSCVNGSKDDLESYPVLVQGGNQGVAIKVDGGRSSANAFVSFFDNDGMQGRIEGQTYGELTTSFDFIWSNAMSAAQEALAVAMAIACGFQLDLGEVAVWGAEAAVIAAEWIEYNVSITNNVGVLYESGSGDYAEWLERAIPAEDYNFGEIVGVRAGKISRNTANADHVMVISMAPIVLGNMPQQGREKDYEKVAFMGQVPVRVMGKVNVGDYIIPSGFSDGYAKAVKPVNMKTEDYARIVGVAWQAGDAFPMNIVNVAVGINTNDLANRVAQQQQAMEVLQQQMTQMQQQMNQMYALVGQKLPYEAANATAPAKEATQVLTLPVPAENKQLASAHASLTELLDKHPEVFVEAFAKAKAKLSVQGVDVNKYPEVASIYNDPMQWIKLQNQKGYLDEMYQEAQRAAKH